MNLKTRLARAFKNFVNILVVVYKTTLENLQNFAQSENGNPLGKSSTLHSHVLLKEKVWRRLRQQTYRALRIKYSGETGVPFFFKRCFPRHSCRDSLIKSVTERK